MPDFLREFLIGCMILVGGGLSFLIIVAGVVITSIEAWDFVIERINKTPEKEEEE